MNQSYEPISLCSPKKALILIFLMKAEPVINSENQFVRSPSMSYPLPSVIKLITYVRIPYRQVELSRSNIIKRDGHTCQYCGTKKSPLTIDHILPKSRKGADTWENLTTACVKCNNKKGNRTPNEAGMKLLSEPKRPNRIIFFKQSVGTVDSQWKQFLFMD